MAKRLDVVGVTGTYEKDGATKQRYTRMGSAWVFDDGNMSIVLEAMPVATPDRNGDYKFQLRTFEPKEFGGGGQTIRSQQQGGGDKGGW